jgi:GNAT superfamily N-acetyltransferase
MEIKQTRDFDAIAHLNEGVQNLHHKLYPEEFKSFDLSLAESAFKRILADPDSIAFLATREGEAIGYILCMIKTRAESEFQYAKTTLLIDQIYVRDAYRKQGLAKALLDKAVDLAREKGIKEIGLNHWEANAAAGEFFAKNGFTYFNRQMRRRV